MANLTRYKQKIFADNSNQVGVFGTGVNKVTSKNVETLQSSDYSDGWSAAVVTNKNYPIWQERDGVDYGFSYQLAYLLQKGIPDWLSTETYYQNDYCKSGNKIYYSLVDNNTNHAPESSPTYWIEFVTSSRNIGEVVTSTIPLTDAGLHLLDGALISGSGSYSAFVNHIAELYGDGTNIPDYFAKAQTIINYTIVGSLTNTDGYLSGFSSSNYIKAMNSFAPSTSSWEILLSIKTGSDVSTDQTLTGSLSTNYDPITIGIDSGKFNFEPSFSSSSTAGTKTGTYSVQTNTEYVLKVKFTGSAYQLDYSTDGGQTFTNDISFSSSSNITTGSLIFGAQSTGSPGNLTQPFLGSIKAENCYVKVNNEVVWEGKTILSPEEWWQEQVTTYGVCNKFVYDSTNNTVRLPKWGNQIWTGGGNASAIGNGKSIGFTYDGENIVSVGANTENINGTYIGSVGYKSGTGTLPYSTSSRLTSNRTLGLTTSVGDSNIITDFSSLTTSLDVYYYVVVATTTKTSIEVDIDEIATDLNGKADVDLSNMNASQSAKNTIVGWGMPDYSAGISISGSSYTAPCDGLACLHNSGSSNSAKVYVNSNFVGIVSNSNADSSVQILLNKNDSLTCDANFDSSQSHFYPLKGVN